MTERQTDVSGGRTASRRPPRSWTRRHGDGGTIPNIAPVYLTVEPDPTLLGFPAEFADDDLGEPTGAAPAEAAPPSGLQVAKRADPIAAGALVLAGVAANVSLLLSWGPGAGPTGVSLVQEGIDAVGSGVEAVQRVMWQPSVVVLCGGLLVLLGLLLLVPARTHRFVGVVALGVALAAAAAVSLLLAESGLADDRFGPGMWCAVAVPVLGVLGALKAMLTAPRVTLGPTEHGEQG
jgi:hypothetical protein